MAMRTPSDATLEYNAEKVEVSSIVSQCRICITQFLDEDLMGPSSGDRGP